jgi:hypothetical protein
VIMNAKIAILGAALLLMAGADALRGCQEQLPKGDAQRLLSTGREGLRAENRIAVDLGLKAHFVQHLVSGFEHDTRAQPKSVSFVAEIPNCVFPAPIEGSKIVFLTAQRGGADTMVHTFSEADVRSAAQQYVEDWRKVGREQPIAIPSGHKPLSQINVVVTDTSQPLHLVLGYPQALYNFQIAPGVTISGVSMIALHEGAVANLPESVPLHVMRHTTVDRCEALPYLRPTPDWQLHRLARQSPGNFREPLATRGRLHTRFDAFFRRSFGQGSEVNMIGGEDIGNVLIGRPPASLEQRLPYRSVSTAQLRMARPANLSIGTWDDLRKALAVKAQPVAEQLASGSLAALNRK